MRIALTIGAALALISGGYVVMDRLTTFDDGPKPVVQATFNTTTPHTIVAAGSDAIERIPFGASMVERMVSTIAAAKPYTRCGSWFGDRYIYNTKTGIKKWESQSEADVFNSAYRMLCN